MRRVEIVGRLVEVAVERLEVAGVAVGLHRAVAAEHDEVVVAGAVDEVEEHLLPRHFLVGIFHVDGDAFLLLEGKQLRRLLGAGRPEEIRPGETRARKRRH